MRPSRGAVLLGGVVIVVVAAVAAGLHVLGSPAEDRARRIDDRRVADLQAIVAAADLYWTRHARLPATLGELASEPGVGIRTADPATSEPYAYRALDGARYEVCATFERQSEEAAARSPTDDLLTHGAGPQCFQLTARTIERKPD